MTSPPPLVVLTGGIASGKTTASRAFEQRGITVVDTDLLAREIVQPGQPALLEIASQLGESFILPDGRLDRSRLRQHIFEHPQARKQLEAITHPRIRQLAMERSARADSPYVLLVVPLYVETGCAYPAWKTVVVDVPEPVQLQRLMARDGMDRDKAHKILKAQASRQARLAVADHVLNNEGQPAELESQVARLHQQLSKQAQDST